ncbi:MAG TPA: APC family permease, partial [Anaerolineales bacterium]|nr:APC family permease [Anaerolineales bacterium]
RPEEGVFVERVEQSEGEAIAWLRGRDVSLPGRYSLLFDRGTGHARLGEVCGRSGSSVARPVLAVDRGRLRPGANGRITGWWFTLWLWTPVYGDMLRQVVIVPLLGAFGMSGQAVWFAGTGTPLFVSSILALVFVSVVIMLGMKTYARIQKFSFYAGVVGLAIVIILLLTGTPEAFKAGFEANSAAYFGTQTSGLVDATAEAGIAAGAATPLTGGSLGLVMVTLPWLVFFNLWPNWGATLYGEVRGATDYKRNFAGMAWALGAVTVLGIVFFLAVSKTIGWDFYQQANGAWWNYYWGYTTEVPPLPVWPNPAMLAAFLTNNRLVQIVILVLMSFWWFGWAGTLFLSSTRVVFAAAFDRYLPEKVAELNKNGTPVNAMLLMVVPAVVVSYMYAYNVGGFISVTLAATQAIAIMYFGTSIAAIVLPYKKKDLYEASPIAKMKVAGIPLITVAGLIFGGFLLFLLVEWFFDPWLNTGGEAPGLYGISLMNTNSVVFLLATYGLAAALYYGFKSKRKSEGIDMDKVQAEIPVE